MASSVPSFGKPYSGPPKRVSSTTSLSVISRPSPTSFGRVPRDAQDLVEGLLRLAEASDADSRRSARPSAAKPTTMPACVLPVTEQVTM